MEELGKNTFLSQLSSRCLGFWVDPEIDEILEGGISVIHPEY